MKSPWEARVGLLIDPRLHPQFVYTYKPHDSGGYGGQPRIDWHACDHYGSYWLIEVKMLPENRKSINLEREVSPGQREALTALSKSTFGQALLAVGQGKTLYIFRWSEISCAVPLLLLLTSARLAIPWSPRLFKTYNLWEALPQNSPTFPPGTLWGLPATTVPGPTGLPLPLMPGPSIPPFVLGPPNRATMETLKHYGAALPETPAAPSPSISKPKDSIRTRRKKLLSGPSLSKPPA